MRKVDAVLLSVMPAIYSKGYVKKVIHKNDWRFRILNDLVYSEYLEDCECKKHKSQL